MAASDNFAPVTVSGLREVPPLIAEEANFAASQRLTLDHRSFEKLLAAAWVLQCLHDQLHDTQTVRNELITEAFKTQEREEIGNSGLPVFMKPVGQPSPRGMGAGSAHGVLSRPGDHETLAELATDEPKRIPLSQDGATLHPTTPPVPVSEKLASDDGKQRARSRPAFNLRTADLRTAFNRTVGAFSNLWPVFRVNLSPRALHAAAIAIPLVLLAMVAALLLLANWRHEPFSSAEAISIPGALAVHTSPPTTTRSASGSANRKLKPALRSSHRQIADPATLSVVRSLSRHEINGLRRQARYGDASAAFVLGMAYEIGRHVPRNCAQAARWVTTAAEAGNAAAQYNLGLRYRDGDGVPANRVESENWLRQAAARRYSKANLALQTLASR